MPLTAHVDQLRASLDLGDHTLSNDVFDEVLSLFLLCMEHPDHLASLQARAGEYHRPEFVLNVDSDGQPVLPSDRALEAWRGQCESHTGAAPWFQETALDGRQVLLVARWLCHFLGLRHRCVEIFLDHPHLPDCTFAQIRSADKELDPGRFDLPCAGHVRGTQENADAVASELSEELGLDAGTDLDGLVSLGQYDHRGLKRAPDRRDVEYRYVFRATLLASALPKVRFPDGEVAAFCLFRLDELRTLLERHPGRVASGLRASFPFYKLPSNTELPNG